MRKHAFALTAAALALTATLAGAATTQIPAQGAGAAASVSPEELQQHIDGRSLPLTYIEEAY